MWYTYYHRLVEFWSWYVWHLYIAQKNACTILELWHDSCFQIYNKLANDSKVGTI